MSLLVAAKVACVKSRDMHWALVAHKDQKDINLSSLRMLLVADGSNPCNVTLTRLRQRLRKRSVEKLIDSLGK